jgi:hypothetical protein
VNTHDEHDDDLEPEVIEGAEFEIEKYPDEEDSEEGQLEGDVTHPNDQADKEKPAIDIEEEPEGEASDTI